MKKFTAAAIVCAVICAVLVLLLARPRKAEVPSAADVPQIIEEYRENEGRAPVSEETVGEPYVSPIDFAALRAGNPDIYAWLDVPGTDVSYPVVQSADDSYYLDRGIDGEKSAAGSIFTESAYNGKDFTDPITVIYGHNMKDGSMFGSLQIVYSSRESIEEHSELVIYLPEREAHYKIFAAVPYDNRHILYNYGDGTVRSEISFLDSVSSVKSLDANIDAEAFAASDDKLVVLSTCLCGDRSRRFIVIAKLV